MGLETYRKQIDEIDSRILELLGRRREVAISVGEYKKANGIDIYSPEREKQIVESIGKSAERYELNKIFVQKVYADIIEYCRKEQA